MPILKNIRFFGFINKNREYWDIFPPILILLFIIRIALPYGNYILIPLLFIAIIFILFKIFNDGFKLTLWRLLVVSISLVVSLFLLIFNYFFRSDFQKILSIEIIHSLSAFVVLVFLSVYYDKKEQLVKSLKLLRKLIIITSGIISLAGILKLLFQFKGVYFEFLDIAGYPTGTSLTIDANFFSLFMVFGLVFLLIEISSKVSFIKSIIYQIILYLLSVNVLLSVSRRGLLIAILVFAIVLFFWFLSFFNYKIKWLKYFRLNTIGYLIILSTSILISYYYIFLISPLKRNELIVNSPFTKSAIEYITLFVHKSKTIYSDSINFVDVRNELWKDDFDPRYPYSGWGIGNYTPVNQISGENYEIVPIGSVGYKLDKTANMSSWNGNSYFYARALSGTLNPGKRYLPSVYCYVSNDFNGDWVRMSIQGKARGIRDAYYDLSQRERWQKLQLSVEGDSVNYSAYLYFAKNNSLSFDSLKGHVIFAYPYIDSAVFNPSKPLTWADRTFTEVYPLQGRNLGIVPKESSGFLLDKNTSPSNSKSGAHIFSNLFRYNTTVNKRYITTIYAYVSENFNGSNVRLSSNGEIDGIGIYSYDLKRKGEWQKLSVNVIGKGGKASSNLFFNLPGRFDFSSLEGYVIFAYPTIDSMMFSPKNPLTWAEGNFKDFFPLTGKNFEIVPDGTIGCLIDKTTNSFKASEGAYYYSSIFKYRTKTNKRYISSIYVYVSKDFNGSNVRIATTGDLRGRVYYYDLNRKGEWQKLIINSTGKGGEAATNVFFNLEGEQNFSNLKGYVVFAYPELKESFYNPKEPITFLNDNFHTVFPLTGKNVEIVPKGSKGIIFNNSLKGKILKDYCYASLDVNEIETVEGDSVRATVYCYVSEDFNGNQARMELRGELKGIRLQRYDLSKKGEWQKLEVNVIAKTGTLRNHLFISQLNVIDFSNLNGYVIFAHPNIELKRDGKWIMAEDLVGFNNIPLSPKYSKAGLFQITANNNDLTKEDTLSQNSFIYTPSSNLFLGPRLDRWRYALYLYNEEYSNFERIFGGGFDHTNKFAETFNKEGEYDYPHNPFLSVLLYSGIIGVLAYLWLMYKVIFLYWLYRRDYWPWFLCFMATFFYSFFSANSPFDPAVMALFMVLPFAIHFIHSKDKNETI